MPRLRARLPGAWVAEITVMLDLASWPKGMGDRPQGTPPGAQLRFTDTPACANLPLRRFAANRIRCDIVAVACDLLAWMQMLAITGPARRREPKRLRLRLAARWPWATQITAAISRLDAFAPD